jgi:hypothetical protein
VKSSGVSEEFSLPESFKAQLHKMVRPQHTRLATRVGEAIGNSARLSGRLMASSEARLAG